MLSSDQRLSLVSKRYAKLSLGLSARHQTSIQVGSARPTRPEATGISPAGDGVWNLRLAQTITGAYPGSDYHWLRLSLSLAQTITDSDYHQRLSLAQTITDYDYHRRLSLTQSITGYDYHYRWLRLSLAPTITSDCLSLAQAITSYISGISKRYDKLSLEPPIVVAKLSLEKE